MGVGGGGGGILLPEAAELDDPSHGLQETDRLVMTGVAEGDPIDCRDDVIGLQPTIPAAKKREREERKN